VLRALADDGKIYQQSSSSQLPVIVLDPRKGERILDMCAAPGSKTSQMAMLMENSGQIVAIESAHQRYYKLKAVLVLLGAENVKVIFKDARLYRDNELFDAVLADVPCSSEGRFSADDPDSFKYWSTRKIKEMQNKQRGLLLSASRLVKPGGRLVYSTCTFAPEENEAVVNWFLKKAGNDFSVEKVSLRDIESYPAILSWGKKTFHPDVSKCLRVLPSKAMEGFFIAHFKRLE
jgi:16S rRNA (cytosine1407-C5)-methyltransferase